MGTTISIKISRIFVHLFTSSTRTSRGRKFPPLKKKHKPIRTLGPIEKNHPPALSLTCLLLWSRQRMCWMTIPRTPSKYSVKCVFSLDVQCRFRNEFTSVLLGNVIEHIQKCIRISIAMCRRNHLPRKCMAPVTTAHQPPTSPNTAPATQKECHD